MISRYSVKKPMTIFVAVILVIILGVISFTNMTTDLLPSMDLPYVVVVTAYPGASPEKVELSVTKPIEQAVATTGGLKEITSVSQENSSMVLMEFVQGTDLDGVLIELSGYLDAIEGSFDENVSTPTVLKINPDMMPVMVASVDMEGKDIAEISKLVSEELLPALQRTDGVASITSMGVVEESLEIRMDQDKINALNQRVLAAVDGQLADAESEIANAQKELDEGREKLKSESAVQSGKLAEATNQLADAKLTLKIGLTTVTSAKAELAKTLPQLKTQEEELTALIAGVENLDNINQGIAGYEQGIAAQDAQITPLKTKLEGQYTQRKSLQEQIAALEGVSGSENELQNLKEQLAALNTDISTNETTLTGLEGKRAGLISQKQELEKTKAGIESALSAMGNPSLDELKMDLTELQAGIKTMEQSQRDLETQESELNAGLAKVETQEKQLEQGKITYSEAMATASANIAVGESAIKNAQEQFEAAKEAAYEKADLEGVITQQMIAQVLAAQNFSMPAGYLEEDGADYIVKVGDQFTSEQQLKDLVLFDTGEDVVGKIYLRDVAEVVFADNSEDIYAKVNGNDGILLMMNKQSIASTTEVSDSINKTIERLEKQYPGLRITALQDQGVYIGIVTDSVMENLLYGGALAILILLLFLKDWRPTTIIAISIPFSLMFAVVMMYFAGVTLNIISLSGLALGVGMLVDNSIVVIENIYRQRSLGVPVHKASVVGARQVAGAIAASTLTTVCVFLPIVFTDGISREIFQDMGLTITFSLVASLIVALTLVPAMASKMFDHVSQRKHSFFDKMRDAYGRSLAWTLKHKAYILILSAALLVICGVYTVSMGMGLFPPMEGNQISASISVPREATAQEAQELGAVAMERIMEVPEVEIVGAMQGGMSMMGGSGGSGNDISMYLVLKEDRNRTNSQVKQEILEKTADLDCEIEVSTQTMDISMLTGSGISVVIRGSDMETLRSLATQTADLLRQTEGTVDISDGQEETSKEIRVVVDKNKAMEYGLTTAQIYQKIALALQDATEATTLSLTDADYPVVIVADEHAALTRRDLETYEFEVTVGEEEKTVRLNEFAEIEEADSLSSIHRQDQSRVITVSAAIDEQHNISLVSREFEKKLVGLDVPDGYTVELEGENESINDAMGDLVFMVLAAIVLIYLIMVAQFQSLLSPFIILTTIPLAFTGGLLALMIAGMELSIVAMLGFLILAGIIVNNGIVLVDYVNTLRLNGMERREALVTAGKTRLRPILMTALTTILGLSTLALGVGAGADMVQPMAVVTVGGLIYATLLTLYVVPALYDIMNKRPPKKIEIDTEKGEDVV